MKRSVAVLCLFLLAGANLVQAAEPDNVPGRQAKTIEGWSLFISDELLEKDKTATKEALELLTIQLQEITRVVPAAAVAELRKVPLWFSPEYSGVQPRAEYHPGAGWLRDNKRDPAMAKGVEFTNVRIFARETKRMPNFTLHELAHAYHDRVLAKGFGNAEIKTAFERAKEKGLYDRVEQRFGDGRSAQVRAYAMASPMEYFAESTEAFFSTNDFFPFSREQLAKHDPEMFELLGKLWLCASAEEATQAEQRVLPAKTTHQLNLLIITADDMNADSSGWNGNALGATPHLDSFAKTAHRFVNSHVTVPICQPGRSALMTGRVPHRNGALGFNPIRRDVPTLVEVLREKGYYTGTIAKAAHMMPAEKFPWHVIGEQALGKQPTKFAEKFREMLAAAAQEKKPFFINANICDPHRPFIAGAGKQAKDDATLDGVKIFQPHEVTVPAFLEDIPRVREEVAQYYSSVSRFDVAFGLVMKELKDAGRDADTIVVFMSDHGMPFPFSKATVYHNGTWSPVLIRVPGMKEPQTRTEFVSSVDVMPSLLELIEVKPPGGMDGRSWVPLLRGESQPDRDFVITHVNTVSSGKSFAQRCVRTKGRALMFHAWAGGPNKFRVEAMSGLSFAAMNAATDATIQARVKQLIDGETLMLFDTAADPTERKNLLSDPKYANDVAQLSEKLVAHMKRTDDPQLQSFEAALTK